MLQFSVGNTEGKYFSQEKFDLLKSVAHKIFTLNPSATNFHLFYDQDCDWHYLQFDIADKTLLVRYYKVFNLLKKYQQDLELLSNFGFDWQEIANHVKKIQG